MTGTRRLIPLLSLLLLLGAAAAPARANTIAGGRLTIELDRGLRATLQRGGAKLRGVKPAAARTKVVNLPLGRGGGVENSGKGRLLTDGGIRFEAGGRRATVTDVVLDTAFGTMSATISGRRLALASAGGLSMDRSGFGATIGLRRLTLTQTAAAAIDRKLGRPGLLRAGQAIGSVAATARFERVRVLDGRNYLALGDMFFEKLSALRVSAKPLGDAWLSGTSIAIPDTVGEVALDLSSGEVASNDGFALKQFESSAELAVHNVSFDFDSGVVSGGITTAFTLPSEARVTPLARFRLSVSHRNAYTGALSGSASPASLTEAFAARLNEVLAEPKGFGPVFQAGEPLVVGFNLETLRRR